MESPWRTLGPVDAVFKRNHLRMLLGTVLLAGAVLFPILINTIFKPSGPKPLTETSLINEQAKYEIQLCTEEFASSSDGYKTNHYYLASDGLSWRIVMLSEATAKRCEPIIDYSYGDTDIAPLPLVVEGLSAAIPEQLQAYALEVVQMLIDENADPTTLQDEIGSLMLVEGAQHSFPLANVLILIGLGGAGVLLILSGRYNKKTACQQLEEADEKGLYERLADDFELAAYYPSFKLIVHHGVLLETGKTLRLQTLTPILRLRCRRRFESFQMPMMLLQAQRSDEPDRWVTLVSAHNSGRSVDEMNRLIDQILNENPAIQWVEDEQNV